MLPGYGVRMQRWKDKNHNMQTTLMRLAKRLFPILASIVIVTVAWYGSLDATAMNQVDAGLKRALTTFATARMFNAVISVAQGTELALQPAGIGINFAPGQLLDPINDLVEQFSDVMLYASVAFGMEKLMISIGSHWIISLLLTGVIIVRLAFYLRSRTAPVWLSKGLLILLMLRFAIPTVLVGTDLVFASFMKNDYEASQGVITSASSQVAELNAAPRTAVESPSMLDKIKGWSANVDVGERVDRLKAVAEQATEHVIKLIVLFLMQTLVLPILLLWCLFGMTKSLLKTTVQYK